MAGASKAACMWSLASPRKTRDAGQDRMQHRRERERVHVALLPYVAVALSRDESYRITDHFASSDVTPVLL